MTTPATGPGARARRFVRRVVAVARKETAHIVRDPATMYLAIGLPVVMLVVFGYGITFDIENTAVAVVDHDRSTESRALTRILASSPEFVVADAPTDADAVDRLFRSGQARAAIVYPDDLGRRIRRGEPADVQILVDGSDGTAAQAVLGNLTGLLVDASSDLGARSAGLSDPRPPLSARVATLYNPALRSAVFFVPGLIAYVLAICGVLLTALTVAREWERGNMELLFATPIGRLEIILGKLAPYLVMGGIQALLVVSLGVAVFDVPMRGSGATLALGVVLFLLGALSQGLLVSVVTRSQQLATQVGALSSLLPALLLSGFIIPIEGMPWILRTLSAILPARYFMHLIRSVMLKGGGLAEVWTDLAGMAAFTVIVLALATRRFGRRVA
ncbi:MAG TPA: ABC transporter permease [Myxococcota bacterium]|nr:ABC transporter permease [Myxococcota bacterium]